MSVGKGMLYIASAAGLALLVRSMLIGPVPLWLALIALIAYVSLVIVGVVVPQLEMFADVTWRGPKTHPEIALTFDDGPHPEHTMRVLKILDDANVKATFFLLGAKVEAHPEVAREIAKRGHRIGVHGYTHDRLLSIRGSKHIARELEKAIFAINEATGQRTTLFRPPVGHTSPRTDTAAAELGLTIVAWSVRGFDGLQRAKPKDVVSRIRRGLRPGAIVLMHDCAEKGDRCPAGIEALAPILESIHSEGFRCVDVSKFVQP